MPTIVMSTTARLATVNHAHNLISIAQGVIAGPASSSEVRPIVEALLGRATLLTDGSVAARHAEALHLEEHPTCRRCGRAHHTVDHVEPARAWSLEF